MLKEVDRSVKEEDKTVLHRFPPSHVTVWSTQRQIFMEIIRENLKSKKEVDLKEVVYVKLFYYHCFDFFLFFSAK